MKIQVGVYIEERLIKKIKIHCANKDLKVQKFYNEAIEEKLKKDKKL